MTASGKIIFVNRFFHPDHSATSQILSDLAFDLARKNQVVVITSRLIYDDPARRLPAAEVVNGVRTHRVATTGFGRSSLMGRLIDLVSFYVSACWALLSIARPGDLVIAKTDPPLLSVFAGPAAALKRARLINWLQDVYPEVAGALGARFVAGALGGLPTALRNASLRGAHTNVVLGERMALHLRASGVPSAQIAIVPNWSDEAAITPVAHAANPLRADWGLKDRFVVGYSGNLGRAHEFETMLGAAHQLRSDPAVVFLMIGGGHHMAALKTAARDAGLTNIVFKPYQPLEALSASLSAADVHWISLRPELEGLIVPSKVYGILAAGRPVLAVTDPEGEIAQLVRTHRCGVHVAPGDPTAFADAIRGMARNPERARTLGVAARAAAEGFCSRETALSRWRAILRDAAVSPVVA